MSEIPLEEFFERVKRLLALFPNHVHVIGLIGLDYDKNEFTTLLKKNRIMYTIQGECFSVYLPECKTDNPLYYYERVYKPLKPETFHIYPGATLISYGVESIDFPQMFNGVSVDFPYIPKLQCDIFDAIFGKAWMEYYTFQLEGFGTLLFPRLEKIA